MHGTEAVAPAAEQAQALDAAGTVQADQEACEGMGMRVATGDPDGTASPDSPAAYALRR